MGKKIRSISVYRSKVDGSSSGDDQGILMSREVFHPDFNKTVLQEQYGIDGQLEQTTVFEYDDRGFLIREVLKEADGTVTEEKSFEPDDRQRIAREYLHYADGSHDTIHYTYDDSGRVIRREIIDSDGDIEEISEMAYQDDQLVHELVKDADGEIVDEHRYVYEDGLLQEVFHYNGQEESSQKRVYSYNDEGHRESVLVYDNDDNLIERFLFENDDQGRPIQIIEENRQKKNTIHMKYANHGHVGFQEEYDMKGNLVSRVERVYDDDGLLLESRIDATVPAMGVQQSYVVKQQYAFFD